MRFAALLFAFVATACTVGVPPPPAHQPLAAGRGDAIAAYARVLQRFVDDRGAVDFQALAADRADLDTYVRFIAATPLESFAPGDERLAHYIDSYNALSMFNVIGSGIPESHAGWRKVVFFALRRFDVGGRRLSLYAYENDVIRKEGDPRIHFALNCSAAGCPRLPREPFTAALLQNQLDRETRRFFASADHLRIDHAGRTVYVSELLDFYREDFVAAAGSLTAFVNRYASPPVPESYALRFIPFDWTIADSRRRQVSQLVQPGASHRNPVAIHGTAATTASPTTSAAMYPRIGFMPSSGWMRLIAQAA